jgi:hypothetical protein
MLHRSVVVAVCSALDKLRCTSTADVNIMHLQVVTIVADYRTNRALHTYVCMYCSMPLLLFVRINRDAYLST